VEGAHPALTAAGPENAVQPHLIETMLVTADRQAPLLARHLDRLGRSAQALGYRCDPGAVEREVRACIAGIQAPGPHRLRLLLDMAGHCNLEALPLAPLPPGQEILLSPDLLDANEPLLRYKTTHRPWYARAAEWLPAHPQVFDMVYMNTDGELCEGSRSNLYLLLDGQWYTPPLASGCLPGVQRAELLAGGKVRERVLRVEALRNAQGLRLSNALRGWFDVALRGD